MTSIRVTDMEMYIGRKVRLCGWIHQLRVQKNIAFIVLRDGYGTGQIVVTERHILDRLPKINQGSAIEVIGTILESGEAAGGVECTAKALKVSGAAAAEQVVDISKKELNVHPSTALDHAALVLRRPEIRFRHRISAMTTSLFRDFLTAKGFTEIHTPCIAAGTMEGGSNVFTLDYFGKQGFLNQSPQLYKQIMTGVFEKVFEVGPVFRAEPHATSRHLNEYISMDAELGFISDHRQVMEVLERLIQFMVKRSYELWLEMPERFAIPWPRVPETIPRLHFAEAVNLAGGDSSDLTPSMEKALGDWAAEERQSDFLFIEGYPMASRPFYTQPDPERPGYSNSFDLLFRGQELVTGGQRLHRIEDYLTAMAARGMDPSGFSHYLEAFTGGMPPHGGFAIGLERWIQSLFGLSNIREASLFPRDCNRLMP